MANDENATAGCLLVGEYLDEGEVPAGFELRQKGEVVRPRVVGNYVDHGTNEGTGVKDFTVLLKQIGTIKVRGHKLKWLQSRHGAEGGGVFAIVQQSPAGEVIVAMFRNHDVQAIFSGTFRPANGGPA
jgi:hypothetical protein